MKISEKAKKELRDILIREIGEEKAKGFSEDELNTLGSLFLNILAEGLKLKVANPALLVPII